MLEYIIAFIIILITLVYFLLPQKEETHKSKRAKSEAKKETKEKEIVKTTPKVEVKEISLDKSKIADNKSYLLNTFREGKEMRHPYISKDGKTILIHDEKRLSLCFLNNFEEKNPKFISKNVESDVISDAAYSEDKKLITVGLKNSKKVIFYELITEGDKQKLNKTNKVIESSRKFEINQISITKDGNFVFTSGTGQDTLIQIFDVKAGTTHTNIDTNEIQNSEIKMTPDDRYLAISTYMYEIAVIELKRTVKFNKAIEGDEITLKVQRNKSVSGIKTPIDNFDFSNDNKYFIVACTNGKIKIFQNYGNFEESKVLSEFSAKEIESFSHDRVSLYITSSFNGKLIGFIAASNENDIYIYDIEGNLIRLLKDAHDDKICLLKLVKKDSTSEECVLISGSTDGRFHVWKV